MADLKVNRQWLIKPTTDVEKKWLQCQIQERKSQVVRLEQDIEDLKNGQIVKLEATIIMLKKEIDKLQTEYSGIEVQLDNVIDV